MRKTWKNGKIIDWEDSKTHDVSHSLHYGSGVFEGIRVYETEKGLGVFKLNEHIERWFYSASVVGIEIPYSKEEIVNAVIQTVKSNKGDDYIRPIVYYGEGSLGVKPKGNPVEVVILTQKFGKYLGDNPVKVMVPKIRRIHPDTVDVNAKLCGSYLNSLLAVNEAKKKGFDEALLLDCFGNVAEGSGENVFFVKGEELYTPKLGTILPGITRKRIIELAKELGYNVNETDINLEMLKEFDEAFFTGTAAEITPIASIDGEKEVYTFKTGEVTAKIKQEFKKITADSQEGVLV